MSFPIQQLFCVLLLSISNLYAQSIHECSHGYIINHECHLGPQSIFQYLIYPISTLQFNSQHFQKQPLYISREHKYYNIESIPFVNAYNNILNFINHPSFYDSTHPQIRITSYNPTETTNKLKYKPFRAKSTEKQNDFDSTTIQQLTHNINGQYTIRFANTEKHLDSIHQLSLALSIELGIAIRASLFYTQPNAKGTRPHFSTLDVIILQLNGSANFPVYSPMQKYCINQPNKNFPFNVDLATDTFSIIKQKSLKYCHENVITNLNPGDEKLGGYGVFNDEQLSQFDPIINVLLTPGDLIYFPRGYVHDPNGFDITEPSVHLAIGIYQELKCDFLFILIEYMFTMDSFSILWENIFLGSNGENELLNKTQIVNDTLRELEYFLTYETFMDKILRETMPYGFYHYDIFDSIVYDNICLPLIENIFDKFISYATGYKPLNNTGKEMFRSLIAILKQSKIKQELGERIFKHYNDVIIGFNGVYSPSKQFKRISSKLNDWDVRMNLPKVLNERL
eukprot:386563_1